MAAPDRPETEPAPASPRARAPWEILAALGVVGGTLALVWMTFSRREEPKPVPSHLDRLTVSLASDGIGDRACAECHPGEAAFHSRSGHARTLRKARDRPDLVRKLADRSVVDPERPGVTWTFRADPAGGLNLERSGRDGVERLVIEYVFGSGHHACTFVSIVSPPGSQPVRGFEHRITYFADAERLDVTPGQLAQSTTKGRTPRGREISVETTLKCFRCHCTVTSPDDASTIEPDRMLANVRCERCHGPGRAHAEAARAGRQPPPMELSLNDATAESQIRVCGQCHRNPDEAPLGAIRPENDLLIRFQPVGLTQSACFRKTPGGLGCTTCHDPHRRASGDAVHYGSVCLSCHGPNQAHPCPRAPDKVEGCTGCHMPKRNSGQSVGFTDHWIRVRARD